MSLSRHGGVQPGGPPGGSAAFHGPHGPGRLPRQVEPAAGGQARPLSGHSAGHRVRQTDQVLPVHRARAQVPVLVS